MKSRLLMNICLLVYLIIPLNGNSQEKNNTSKTKNEFTLSKAIEYALKHNRNILNANLNIKAAEEQQWETIAIGLPQINAAAEYTNAFIRPSALSAAPANPEEFSPSFLFPRHKFSPTITLTQLIFDGSYLVGLQSSKVFLKISENAKIKTNKEVEKAVVSAYNNILLTKESVVILKKNISNVENNISETKALLQNGMVEEEDLEQLQVTLNDLNNNLENLNNLYSISKNYLKLLIGYKTTNTIVVTDSLENLIDEISLNIAFKKKISVFENIDYKIAENKTESKRLLHKLEVAKKLPTLGSFINGGYFAQSNPNDKDRFRFFSNKQPWFGSMSVGFKLDIPVFSSFGSKAKTERAKIEWEISKNELDDKKEELEINIKKINSELTLAVKTLENKKANLNLTERIEQKNSIKYKEGISSSFELRQSQIQLYAGQQNYLQAMVDVINKQAELNALKK